jgi:hypothetical protein
MTENDLARVTDRDGAYLGRDSPWRAVTRRSVDVWTVTRIERTSTDETRPTPPMPFIRPRRPRNQPSHAPGHSLPLAA